MGLQSAECKVQSPSNLDMKGVKNTCCMFETLFFPIPSSSVLGLDRAQQSLQNLMLGVP